MRRNNILLMTSTAGWAGCVFAEEDLAGWFDACGDGAAGADRAAAGIGSSTAPTPGDVSRGACAGCQFAASTTFLGSMRMANSTSSTRTARLRRQRGLMKLLRGLWRCR